MVKFWTTLGIHPLSHLDVYISVTYQADPSMFTGHIVNERILESD